MAKSITPKIARKLVTRSVILMITLAVLFYGYHWAQQQKGDFDFAPANTSGMVAAIRLEDEGSRAVAFGADGKLIENPGYEPGNTDRDLVWQPDGNRVFFVSDRAKVAGTNVKAFNIFRWNPTTGDMPSQRTEGTRGRSNPSFSDEEAEGKNASALIVSGGFVLEFTPKDKSTRQVLPPVSNEVAAGKEEEGDGSVSQFSQAYENLGTSFRIAKWVKGKRYIAAVMRSDTGEVLVLQDLEPGDKGLKPPRPVVAGEHVEIAISPKDGKVVYSVQNFRWPNDKMIPDQFKKGNVVTVPFRHSIGIFDPENPDESAPVAISNSDKIAFGQPSISPDSSVIAVTVGNFADTALAPKQLVVMPLRSGGGASPAVLVQGEVYEPSWHPNGKSLVYVKRANGKRTLFTIGNDGSNEKALSTDGDFASPKFSPQSK